jgi:CHAT domain-containing protein
VRKIVYVIAPLEYLGVGDPRLDKNNEAELAPALARSAVQSGGDTLQLEDIPDTAKELSAVAGEFSKLRSDVLLGDDATEEKFREEPLSNYNIIHFATHGLFNPDKSGQSESALVLTPEDTTDPFDDGVLSASE